MALGETPKTPAEAEKAFGELTPEQIQQLSGVQQIIHYLKKKDWAAMAGAMMAVWTEYFGSPEEKSALAEKKEEEEKSEEIRDDTRKELGDLREGVEKTEEEAENEDPAKAEVAGKNAELPSASDSVFIGDSMLKGMRFMMDQSRRPDFIGESGYSSMKTLEALQESKHRLKGKKKALIYTGGNNVAYSSAESIVSDMIAMAKICSEAGIPEIIVCTRFPNDPRRKSKMIEKSAALREYLLKAHKEGRFPAEVRLVDLYKRFADSNGDLQEQYVRPESKDYIHPRGVYKSALGYIYSSKSGAAV